MSHLRGGSHGSSTILVPTDFAPHSAQALEYAIRLGQHFDSRIHLLLAYTKPLVTGRPGEVIVPNDFWGTDHKGARKRLAHELEKVRAAGLKGHLHLVEGLPSEAIREVAVEIRADLIVMGSRGRTGLRRTLKGSVAERMTRIASCPVLTVKTPEADRAVERIPREERHRA